MPSVSADVFGESLTQTEVMATILGWMKDNGTFLRGEIGVK